MSVSVKFGKSQNLDAAIAVKELVGQVGGENLSAVMFFASPKYNRAVLGREIAKAFDSPAIGCTTAGEIGQGCGYTEDSIVCVSIASDKLTMKPVYIRDLKSFVASPDPKEMRELGALERNKNFVLFLVDGMSHLEDRVVAIVNRYLNGAPLIGASAADNLNFGTTWVYCDGSFHDNMAVAAVFETSLPFKTFKVQHFEPTSERFVITGANQSDRTVSEINGLPAAQEFARLIGCKEEELGIDKFSSHPVMLKIGGEFYVREIQQAKDGKLYFFSAIDIGLVLTIARATDILGNLESCLEQMRIAVGKPSFIFGSDCICRRIEMKGRGELEKANEILAKFPFFGFSTYGEQFNGVHVNHTLTALALGSDD